MVMIFYKQDKKIKENIRKERMEKNNKKGDGREEKMRERSGGKMHEKQKREYRKEEINSQMQKGGDK
jgi:hypothetical protein